MTQAIEAPTVGIGRLLKEGSARFVVPHHQRDYSWTEDELSQFFSDVAEAQGSKAPYYFLGLMVFIPGEGGDITILDGQQRMATTVIVMSAIRTWLRAREQVTDADQIQAEFIASREFGESDFRPRLVLNEANNHHFETYVVHERPTSDITAELKDLRRYDPNRTLLEAIIYCRSEVDRIAAEAGSVKKGAAQLVELVKLLRDSVKIVRLLVPSEADAYTVFETLNDRGLDLTVLDLVKNHIFGRAGSKIRLGEIKSRWTQMMATLTNVRGDDFLKAYWTSRHGRTQKAQLFPQLKAAHKTAESVVQVSIDLLGASEHFAAIESPDDPHWTAYSDVARERIRALRLLRSQSIHPIILAGLAKFRHREMDRLLSLLEVLIVRYQVILGGRTGLLEIASARLAADIYQGRVTSATEAHQSLKDIYPSDPEFREAFHLKQERTNGKVQYLLRRLEETERKRTLGKKAEELGPKNMTVEHIYPRGESGGEWAALDAADPTFADECTYRLGNMTLLSSINRDLGTKGFDKKRRVYDDSDLLLTKELSGFKAWDREAVSQRQKRLADLAVMTWRFQ